jgi:hypothetical protein
MSVRLPIAQRSAFIRAVARTRRSLCLLHRSIRAARSACRANRPARLRKSNHNLLSRCCRLAGLLNLDSRPLTGNSVRRAGSNSPPRSGPRSEIRRGPGPDSVHSFFVRFDVPRLRARDSGRSISPDGLGSSRHRVGHTLRIWAWRHCRRFKFRNVFHVVPCAVPAEAGRRSFEELSSCNATKVCVAVSAAIKP